MNFAIIMRIVVKKRYPELKLVVHFQWIKLWKTKKNRRSMSRTSIGYIETESWRWKKNFAQVSASKELEQTTLLQLNYVPWNTKIMSYASIKSNSTTYDVTCEYYFSAIRFDGFHHSNRNWLTIFQILCFNVWLLFFSSKTVYIC